MISFLTPLATDGIGYSYGFVFAGTNLAGAVLVYFFLYESVSLSLENVDLMYSDPTIKPWNSKKWMPPGHITRMQRDDEYFHNRNGNGLHSDDDRTHVGSSGRPSHAMEKKESDGLGQTSGYANGSGEMRPNAEGTEKVNARV